MVIGDEILVTVMGVSGHTVRLGIEAPGGVSIYREEIWLAVKEENRAAASAADPDALPSAPLEAPATGSPRAAAQKATRPPSQSPGAAAGQPPPESPAD